MKRFAVKTLGCKANTFESNAIAQLFKENGYEHVDHEEIADVYVINTCSVTNSGDRKSRQAIRRMVRKNSDAVIAVVGCYSQLQPESVIEIEGVDIVLGTSKRDELVTLVEEYIKKREPIVKVSNIMKEKSFEQLVSIDFDNQTRAFVKIQEGCNNFCTFCIIPWARGLIRSQDPKIIVSQIQSLSEKGFKEVVLTGIHTGGYGEDFEDYNFANLLRDIESKTEIERLRISSIEITQLDDEVLDIISKSHIIVDHLHVPIQAASDTILSKMRRNYNLREYSEKISQLRNIFTDISITTDLIVGFPGETDSIFEESLNKVRELNFSEIHVFNYSKRSGTPAARMENQVDDTVKKQRISKMIELNNELAQKYSERFQGAIVEVLVESKKGNIYQGHTTNYLKVEFECDYDITNEIVNVEIVESGYPINRAKIV